MAMIQTPCGRVVGLILPKEEKPQARPEAAEKKAEPVENTDGDAGVEKPTRRVGRPAKK